MQSKNIYFCIDYADYKKYTKCREIARDIIKASLVKNKINNFKIHCEIDKYTKCANNYPFNFSVFINNTGTYDADYIKLLVLDDFVTWKANCSKVKISRESALKKFEADRVLALKKKWDEVYKKDCFNINTATIIYSDYINTIGILEGLYKYANLKTDFKTWFKNFSKRNSNYKFADDKTIDKLIKHDKEVLKHITVMKSMGHSFSNNFSNYTIQKM